MELTTQQPLGQMPGQYKGRIEYIDALRGFTMILVVFYHVAFYCWHVYGKGISIHDYLVQFRMPTFFFISGFLIYKAGLVWDTKQIVRFFKKKIPVQLVFPFIFFLVYIYIHRFPFASSITDHTKVGYWFTYALLEYYIFYAATRFLVRSKWVDVVLIITALIIYPVNSPRVYDAIPLPEAVKGALSMRMWCYYFFFVLGSLVRKHFTTVEKLLDTKWFLPCCIIYYFGVNILRDVLPTGNTSFAFTLSLTGLIILFSFFRINKESFSHKTTVGKTLQYIGRRTLDVYLIHYFLIPKQLSFVTVFADHPMPVIEATTSLIISALIIAGCLLIGNIIRLSPFLAHWVFGAKYPSK